MNDGKVIAKEIVLNNDDIMMLYNLAHTLENIANNDSLTKRDMKTGASYALKDLKDFMNGYNI